MFNNANVNDLQAALEPYINDYKLWMQSKDYQDLLEERMDQSRKFKRLLGRDRILELQRKDISWILSRLWSLHHPYARKYVREIIEINDISTIKESLYDLIWGSDEITIRFDRMIDNIRGIGSGVTSEILLLANPQKYIYWSIITRKALLEINWITELANCVNIKGQQYQYICKRFLLLRNLLNESKIEITDNLKLDLFLYRIAQLRLELDDVHDLVNSIKRDLSRVIDRAPVLERHRRMLKAAWHEAQENISKETNKLIIPGSAIYYHQTILDTGFNGAQMRLKKRVYKKVQKLVFTAKTFSPTLLRIFLKLLNTLLGSLVVLVPGIHALSEIKDYLEALIDIKANLKANEKVDL